MENSNAIEKTAHPAPLAGANAGITQSYTRLLTVAGATVVQTAPLATAIVNAEPELRSGLTERQLTAIDLLISGQCDRQVAEALGLCRKTVWNWRHESDAFKEELHKRREELWSGAADRMRALLEPSLQILSNQLSDALDKNRYRAAVAILRLSNVRHAIPINEEKAK